MSPSAVLRRMTLIVLACVGVGAPAAAQESDGFRMKRVTATTVADRLTSANYANSVTAITVGGAAGVCPSGTTVSLGFWSLRGSMPVPVRLTLDKNATDPGDLDLSWTGQSSQFEVYRASSPADLVFAGNLYQTTSACGSTDSEAASDLLFYRVTGATPPGTGQ